jgi:hypothetical protein
MDRDGRCQTCSYWESRNRNYRADSPDGECHKDAPHLLTSSVNGFGSWPKTEAFEWCGSWALAGEAAGLHERRQRGAIT